MGAAFLGEVEETTKKTKLFGEYKAARLLQ